MPTIRSALGHRLTLLAFACLLGPIGAQEVLPDDRTPAPPSAKPASTPTSIDGAETFVYRAGEPEPMRLHVVKPKGWSAQDRRPALIHFFGGGFVRGTPLQSAGWARVAARWGMVGLAPDYRTSERFRTDATATVMDARRVAVGANARGRARH